MQFLSTSLNSSMVTEWLENLKCKPFPTLLIFVLNLHSRFEPVFFSYIWVMTFKYHFGHEWKFLMLVLWSRISADMAVWLYGNHTNPYLTISKWGPIMLGYGLTSVSNTRRLRYRLLQLVQTPGTRGCTFAWHYQPSPSHNDGNQRPQATPCSYGADCFCVAQTLMRMQPI